MNIDELTAEYVLRGTYTSDLKEHAYELMLAGYESPSLAALAGAEKNLSPAELRDLFECALRELGVTLPDRLTAGNVMKRSYARRVVTRELSPREGAQRIVGLLHELECELPKARHYVGDSFGVANIVGLYYSYDDIWDDDPTAVAEIDEAIGLLCERVARGEDANP